MLILAVAGAAAAAREIGALRRDGHGDDLAGVLLELAVRGLPAEHAPWGVAMLVESSTVADPRARRRFSLGCAWSAVRLRVAATFTAHDRGARRVRAGLLGSVFAALLLPVYGLARYPALRASPDVWLGAAALVATLLVYALCAWALLRGATPAARTARRRAILAGGTVGAAWLCVLAPGPLKQWVLVALACAVACPLGVAVLTGRTAPGARTGPAAALESGVVGGLVVFLAWVTASYLRAAGPYDPQLVRDFHRSGARDLASYAVAGDLGTALGLLVVIPILCGAFGCLACLVVGPRPAEPDHSGRS